MRTESEILDRIDVIADDDWLGTRRNELIPRLSFDKAKSFLKDSVTENEWLPRPRDHEQIKKEMLEYMPFAWEKANNCRGISAARSIDHYKEWLWLLGDCEIDLDSYELYGKPQLKRICAKYGWDWRQWHNGLSGNNEGGQTEDNLERF